MRPVVYILLLLALLGCKKGYDQSQMAKLTAPEQKIVGKYKMELELNTGDPKESKEFANILEMLDGGETTLECFPDKTFVMNTGMSDVKGNWSLQDTFVTLRISDVGGVKPDKVVKADLSTTIPANPFSMSQEQRDEFLKSYANSIALEKAEDMSYLRVSTDGTLYRAGEQKATLFGTLVRYFKRMPKD